MNKQHDFVFLVEFAAGVATDNATRLLPVLEAVAGSVAFPGVMSIAQTASTRSTRFSFWRTQTK